MQNREFEYYNILKTKDYFDYREENILIWGLGESALYTLIDLTSAGCNVVGFTDSYVSNTYSPKRKFAGYPIYFPHEIRKLGSIVVFIATWNTEYITEILYTIEALKLENVSVISRGHAIRAKEYDIASMNKLIEDSFDIIDFVRNMLDDERSKKTYDSLLEYKKTNNRNYLKDAFEDSHKQYFPDETIFIRSKKEIFVDAGGYDGKTTIDFFDWAQEAYEASYILEAEEVLFNVCKEMVELRHIPNVEVHNKAVSSKSGILLFDDNNFDTGSAMEKDTGKPVPAISIDEMLNGREASFIKMDIEGGEMDALLGCKKTIARYKPKLAISIYHWDDDLWNIPYYLMKEYPFYKYYIRHYTRTSTETVLYASI